MALLKVISKVETKLPNSFPEATIRKLVYQAISAGATGLDNKTSTVDTANSSSATACLEDISSCNALSSPNVAADELLLVENNKNNTLSQQNSLILSILPFKDDSWLQRAVGALGATRRKIAGAACCIVEFVGRLAVFVGEPAAVANAQAYLAFYLEGREAQLVSSEKEKGVESGNDANSNANANQTISTLEVNSVARQQEAQHGVSGKGILLAEKQLSIPVSDVEARDDVTFVHVGTAQIGKLCGARISIWEGNDLLVTLLVDILINKADDEWNFTSSDVFVSSEFVLACSILELGPSTKLSRIPWPPRIG